MQLLLTDADIARVLRTTPRKIADLVRSAGLPSVTLPEVGMRFLPADVDRWIRDRQQQKGSHA